MHGQIAFCIEHSSWAFTGHGEGEPVSELKTEKRPSVLTVTSVWNISCVATSMDSLVRHGKQDVRRDNGADPSFRLIVASSLTLRRGCRTGLEPNGCAVPEFG